MAETSVPVPGGSESSSDEDVGPLLIDFSEWTVLDDSFSDCDNCIEDESEVISDLCETFSYEKPNENLSSIPSGNSVSRENIPDISKMSHARTDLTNRLITYSKTKADESATVSRTPTDCMISPQFTPLSDTPKRKLKNVKFVNEKPCPSGAPCTIGNGSRSSESVNSIPKKPLSVQKKKSCKKSGDKQLKQMHKIDATSVDAFQIDENVLGNLGDVMQALKASDCTKAKLTKDSKNINTSVNVKGEKKVLSKDNIDSKLSKQAIELLTPRCEETNQGLTKESKNIDHTSVNVKGEKKMLSKDNQPIKNKTSEPKNVESRLFKHVIELLTPRHEEIDQGLKMRCDKENDSKILTQSGNSDGKESNNVDLPQRTHVTSNTAKRSVRRFHRSSQTDVKKCLNKEVQCTVQQNLQSVPSKQCISVGTQCEEDRHIGDDSASAANLIVPVSKEMFKLALDFRAGNSIITGMPTSGRFKYGIRLGYLLPSDVGKSSFWDTIAKKSDSYTLSFPSQVSGVLDLQFLEEESLANMVKQVRKTRLGLRYLCLSISKMLDEKDENGNVPINCLKATIVFDQNFSSMAYPSGCKTSVGIKSNVDDYVTIHHVPGGIPISFLRLIFPNAITIEMDDTTLKFTKNGCRVKLGLDRKNYPGCFKNLFRQVVINDTPVSVTYGLTEEKELPKMKERQGRQKEQEELEQSKPKERELGNSLTAVARDVNANVKKHRTSDIKKAEVLNNSKIQEKSVQKSYAHPTKGSPCIPPQRMSEDVIDLTEEASSPLKDRSKELSDISDSSFDSDALESPVYSSSEDEGNNQHDHEKKSKTFNKLYDKYVLKSRKSARSQTSLGGSHPEQKSSNAKGTVLCGVTKDLLSSVRVDTTNDTEEKKSNISFEKMIPLRERFLRRRSLQQSDRIQMEVNGDEAQEKTSLSQSSFRNKRKEIGSSHRPLSSESTPRRRGIETMTHREYKKSRCLTAQQERSRVLFDRKGLEDQYSHLGGNQRLGTSQWNGSLGGNEGDLRTTIDNLRASQQMVQRKEAKKEASPVIRSFLSECMSKANRKRQTSRSPSPTIQRKVLLVRKPYSPTQRPKDDIEEESPVPISVARELEENHPSSEQKTYSNTSLISAQDKTLSHHVKEEKPTSEDQFTVSKSLLVKLMKQIIVKGEQPGVSNLQLPGCCKSNDPNIPTQERTVKKSVVSVDKDMLIKSERPTRHGQSSEDLLKSANVNKIEHNLDSKPSHISMTSQDVVKKQSPKDILKLALSSEYLRDTRKNQLIAVMEGSEKSLLNKIESKQTDSRTSNYAHKPPTSPGLLPPMPPPVVPPILDSSTASTQDASCSQSETFAKQPASDSLSLSISDGVWMAPPSFNNPNIYQPVSSYTLAPSVSAQFPMPPIVSAPILASQPLMHPMPFQLLTAPHPLVHIPSPQLQVPPLLPQTPTPTQSGMMPMSGVWQVPPPDPSQT